MRWHSSFIVHLHPSSILSSTLYLRLTWALAGGEIIPVRCRTRSKLRCKVDGRATFSLLHEPGGSGSPPGFVFPATRFVRTTSTQLCAVFPRVAGKNRTRDDQQVPCCGCPFGAAAAARSGIQQ